jgi:hypothetical protein
VTTCQYISSHKSCILAINQFSFSPHEHTVQQGVSRDGDTCRIESIENSKLRREEELTGGQLS